MKKYFVVLLLFALICSVCPSHAVFAAEPDFARGSSLAADDQKAAAGTKNCGELDITWLDLGEGAEWVDFTVYEFDEETVFVLKWGNPGSEQRVVIDREGSVLVPTGYDEIRPVAADLFYVSTLLWTMPKEEDQLIAGGSEYSTKLIDREGREVIIGEGLTPLGAFQEGLIRVRDDSLNEGFADESGNLIIPCEHYIAYDFSEGYAATYDSETHLWAHIDKTGELLTERRFSQAESFQEGLALVNEKGVFKYLDQQGQVAITLEDAQYAYSFSGGLALVLDANGKFGYIDKTGSYAIPPVYDEASEFSGPVTGVAYRSDSGGYQGQALINKSGESVTPIGIYAIYSGGSDGLILSRSEESGLWGYLDEYGSEAVPFIFENAWHFHDGIALVQLDGNSQYVGILKKPQAASRKVDFTAVAATCLLLLGVLGYILFRRGVRPRDQ